MSSQEDDKEGASQSGVAVLGLMAVKKGAQWLKNKYDEHREQDDDHGAEGGDDLVGDLIDEVPLEQKQLTSDQNANAKEESFQQDHHIRSEHHENTHHDTHHHNKEDDDSNEGLLDEIEELGEELLEELEGEEAGALVRK